MKLANSQARTAIELLLKSMFWGQQADNSGITAASGFEVIRTDIGIGFYYGASELLDAALFIRRHASPHLRALSVQDLQAMLLAFVDKQLGEMRFAWSHILQNRPFFDYVLPGEIERLANEMSQSPVFMPPNNLFLFPLAILEVKAAFRCQIFSLLSPEELRAELSDWYDADELSPHYHPPIPMFSKPIAEASCWLAVHSSDSAAALRMRNAIMGACALLPHPLERYAFSMRQVPKGHCSFEGRATYHTGDASSPPLGEDIVLTTDDHEWLRVLCVQLTSDASDARKNVLALQYFFRAWVRDPATRVAPLCGALDALYGDQDKATQAMVSAIGSQLGPAFDAPRAKWLAKLRAGVIHGGAPNIYEASVYHRYWVKYRCDPIRDLELVTARCLQGAIFGSALVERPHTYAELLRRHTGAVG